MDRWTSLKIIFQDILKDLSIAISKSLDCDENKIINSINKFTWDECFKIFKVTTEN